MDSPNEAVLECRNCGQSLDSAYCPSCGEPRHDAHEWSWHHFAHHAFHEFILLDSSIFRTFWLLFRRPGSLTSKYQAGRRTSFIRPLRLYIIAAAIHLLAVSSGFYAVDFIRIGESSQRLDKLVEVIAARANIPKSVAGEQLNHQFQRIYGGARYFTVALFALSRGVLGDRRWAGRSHFPGARPALNRSPLHHCCACFTGAAARFGTRFGASSATSVPSLILNSVCSLRPSSNSASALM